MLCVRFKSIFFAWTHFHKCKKAERRRRSVSAERERRDETTDQGKLVAVAGIAVGAGALSRWGRGRGDDSLCGGSGGEADLCAGAGYAERRGDRALLRAGGNGAALGGAGAELEPGERGRSVHAGGHRSGGVAGADRGEGLGVPRS